MTDERDREVFVAVLEALGDHLSKVVIVGGWAHRLHRTLEGVDTSTTALYTQDLDFAVPRPPEPADPPLNERLTSAGFEERVKGEGQGVTEYLWTGDDSALTVEFLVHRVGAEASTGLDLAGVRAQRLRHLDIAFVSPCEIVISESTGYSLEPGEELRVRVANPAAFVMNKLLTYERRTTQGDKGKDLLYIFDTLRNFAPTMELLRQYWCETWPALASATRKKLAKYIDNLREARDVAEDAARIAAEAGRPVPADRLLRACVAGIETLLKSTSQGG